MQIIIIVIRNNVYFLPPNPLINPFSKQYLMQAHESIPNDRE